jgi:oxaloacetate decarboxylase gamma subunit
MQESLFTQGLSLLVYGMGTVYVFLGLLIAVTSAISKVVVRFFPEAPPAPKAPKTFSAKPAAAVDPQTLSVIKAAIDQHRARRSR